MSNARYGTGPTGCLLISMFLAHGLFAAEHCDQRSEALGAGNSPAKSMNEGCAEVPSLGLVAHASKMIGQKVKDQDEHPIGQLQDLLIELPGGEVHAGIVEIGPKRFAVPARAFFPADDARIIFNADEKLFKNAPEFIARDDGVVPKSALVQSFKHFAHRPPDPATGSEQLRTVTSIIGNNLQTSGGESVGRLTDVVVEFSNGRTIYVILTPTLGALQTDLPVPPELFKPSDQKHTLVFTGTPEQLLNGPMILAQFPTLSSMPEFASWVYRHYGVQFSGPTERAPSLSNTQAHPPLTPTGRTDAEIRQGFLRAITQDAAMPAAEAKDLFITVYAGTMTLSGRVRNESQKHALISAAQEAAGPRNVIDNVVVR